MSKAFRTFSNEKELEIIEEFNSGFSVADLSKIYSCSKGVIYNLFKRHKNEKEDTSNTLLRFLQR
jgi:Mor family transcriptional regulator